MAAGKTRSADVRAKVALEAIREGRTLAALSKTYGAQPNMLSTWTRSAIATMAAGVERGKSADTRPTEAEIEKRHSKIGQLVVGRDVVANASHRLRGARASREFAIGQARPVNGTKNGARGSQAEPATPGRFAAPDAIFGVLSVCW